MKNIEVVAAVIRNEDNLMYCVQRNDKGEVALKWEFPGGKIESGETNEEALVREIKEELSVDIKVGNFITTVNYQYLAFNLKMHVYYATVISGVLTLNEHLNYKWLNNRELSALDWAPADIEIIKRLILESR